MIKKVLFYTLCFLCSAALFAQQKAPSRRTSQDSALSFARQICYTQPHRAISITSQNYAKGLRLLDSNLMANSQLIQAQAQFNLANVNKGLALANEALSYFQIENNLQGQWDSYLTLGRMEVVFGNYVEAAHKLKRSVDMATQLNDSIKLLQSQISLSSAYQLLGEIELSENSSSLASQISSNLPREKRTASLNLLLAEKNLHSRNFIGAERQLQIATKLSKMQGDSLSSLEINQLYGQLYFNKGEVSKALTYNLKAFDLVKLVAKPQSLTQLHIQASELHLAMGSFDMALQHALQAKKMGLQLSEMLVIQKAAFKQLSNVYLQKGDSAKAFKYVSKAQEVESQLDPIRLTKSIGNSKKPSNTNKDTAETEVTTTNGANFNAWLITIGSILVSILLFIALVRKPKTTADTKIVEVEVPVVETNKEEVLLLKKEIVDLTNKFEIELEGYKKLDDTKNKVFSVLTHDLRQPINQIKSVLGLLEIDDLSGPDRVEIIEKLKESVDNSSNALENLLLWSKKQLTGINTNIVDVHLLPQVWQLESQLAPNLNGKDITFKINIPDFFKVKADMNQLDICLRNLVTNAIKFSNKGGIISVEAVEENNQKIVRIVDNGIGMAPEQLQKLRELSGNFSTLGTMNEKGTGLGVLITREFMKNQNGDLEINSRKGEGSVFSLVFNDTSLILPRVQSKETQV